MKTTEISTRGVESAKDVQKFIFNGAEVRTVIVNGEPWFVAKDVSVILGYDQVSNMIKRLDEDESCSSRSDERFKNTLNNSMGTSYINESGLYNAVIGSIRSEAKAFKKWITSEVLPSIRKTGSYSTNQPLSSLDILKHQVTIMEEMNRRQEEMDSKVTTIESKIRTLEARSTVTVNNTFTIAGFARLKDIRLTTNMASQLGRYATKLSKAEEYPIGTIYDVRFGTVSTYNKYILEKTFDHYFK